MSKGIKIALLLAGCAGAWFAVRGGGSQPQISAGELRRQAAPSERPAGPIERPGPVERPLAEGDSAEKDAVGG